jgi:hypothetical protein
MLGTSVKDTPFGKKPGICEFLQKILSWAYSVSDSIRGTKVKHPDKHSEQLP